MFEAQTPAALAAIADRGDVDVDRTDGPTLLGRHPDHDRFEERAGRPLDAVWPLTPLQEGLFYLHALGGADVYTVQQRLDLDGDLDPARLRTAAETLLRRHPNLRAAFTTSHGGTPVQVIPAGVTVAWSALPYSEGAADTERELPFDLADPPLIRC